MSKSSPASRGITLRTCSTPMVRLMSPRARQLVVIAGAQLLLEHGVGWFDVERFDAGARVITSSTERSSRSKRFSRMLRCLPGMKLPPSSTRVRSLGGQPRAFPARRAGNPQRLEQRLHEEIDEPDGRGRMWALPLQRIRHRQRDLLGESRRSPLGGISENTRIRKVITPVAAAGPTRCRRPGGSPSPSPAPSQRH